MNKSTLEILSQLFGCYFHQDFRCDYERPENAVDAYIEENPGSLTELYDAFDDVVKMNLSEDELRKLIRECDSNYGPWILNEYTAKEWINYIRVKLNGAINC